MRNVKSDSSGFYTTTQLPIGTYEVDASETGFRPQEHTNIPVVADAKLTVDFHLQLGNLKQTVEVTATTGETLNTTSGRNDSGHRHKASR